MQCWQSFKRQVAQAWALVWSNRTKITGYLGIAGASIEMGIQGGQRYGMLILGALVALIGHYNDHREAS